MIKYFNENLLYMSGMYKIKCDVLVVGAGPAGSSAARFSALNGLKTILIDEKKEIGHPVRCAEGIGDYLFPYLPFKIPKRQLIWRIRGMVFWADNVSIRKTGNPWSGYSVNRESLDKWLAWFAASAGAKVFPKTKLIDLDIQEDNVVKKAIVIKEKQTMEIYPKVIIAADGSESTVLKILGLYNPKKGDLAEVYSWEMKNLDLVKPHFEQIFLGDFAPCGYAYIFPKSRNIANIGVGGLFPKKKMEYYFDEFLEIEPVKKQTKKAEYVTEKSKKAVWGDITSRWIYGNVILAGDAANQNLKPFIEGILPSIICGSVAGKLSINFIRGCPPQQEKYLSRVESALQPHFRISKEIQNKIVSLFKKVEKNRSYLDILSLFLDNS